MHILLNAAGILKFKHCFHLFHIKLGKIIFCLLIKQHRMGDINYDHELDCIEETNGEFKVVCKCGCKGGEWKHTHLCYVKIIDCPCGGCPRKKKKRIVCYCNKENPQGPRN